MGRYLLVVPIRNSGIFGKEVINILFNVKMKLKLSTIYLLIISYLYVKFWCVAFSARGNIMRWPPEGEGGGTTYLIKILFSIKQIESFHRVT